MLRSMTGYGKAELETKLARYTIEIQSINRKHLDIFLSIPRDLSRFEIDLRKWISSALTRGQISLKLHVEYRENAPVTVKPQIFIAGQVKKALEEITSILGLQAPKIDAAQLIRTYPGILAFDDNWEDEEAYKKEIKEVLELALKKMIEMKDEEGASLAKDIIHRLDLLRGHIKEIQKFAPDATQKQREKLKQKLEEFLPGSLENEEKIIREIILYAEKVDISEELTRFNSHLDQLHKYIKSTETSIGKTFEFVLQELLRETNTIGSKASDVNVTKIVVEMKSEIEKLREQIQNVE